MTWEGSGTVEWTEVVAGVRNWISLGGCCNLGGTARVSTKHSSPVPSPDDRRKGSRALAASLAYRQIDRKGPLSLS